VSKTGVPVSLMHRITPPGELGLKGDYAAVIVNSDDIRAPTHVTKLTHPLKRTPGHVGHLDGLAELVDEASFRLIFQRGHNHLR
jgi:hypothetical protein